MRNIAICIGNRADGGPLGPVISEINKRDDLTYEIVNPLSLQLNHLRKDRFDWLLVLGDRHELLLACHSAIYAQIPIAHIHGGETTLGSFDDRVRNSVSQLATLHFTAAEPFSQRLRSMSVPGEVVTVGPPGLDDLEVSDRSEFGEGYFLVCLHPETAGGDNVALVEATCRALDKFPDCRVVILEGNSDPGYKPICNRLLAWKLANHARAFYYDSFDRPRYLTALKHASVCIGNSSSFVIEAPALGTPTVNVGHRQEGRPMAPSIITAHVSADGIANGIENRLRYGPFLGERPYGSGGASKKIAEVLATWSS